MKGEDERMEKQACKELSFSLVLDAVPLVHKASW